MSCSHLPRWVTASLPELPLRNLSTLISPPLFHFLPFEHICFSRQSPDPGAEHLCHDSGQLSPKPPALWFSMHLQICLSGLPAVYCLSLLTCFHSLWLVTEKELELHDMKLSVRKGRGQKKPSSCFRLICWTSTCLFPWSNTSDIVPRSSIWSRIRNQQGKLYSLILVYQCAHRGGCFDSSRQSTLSNV